MKPNIYHGVSLPFIFGASYLIYLALSASWGKLTH
jgi:hypothetical protein